MNVKVIDYGIKDGKNYVDYKVFDIPLDYLEYIEKNLDEEVFLYKKEEYLILRMYFDKGLFPFKSEESKFKLDDFIATEEIEMNVFLSSFLEDYISN